MPILYILMRKDMDSLVPGKAIAQGSHATSLFEKEMAEMASYDRVEDRDLVKAFQEWNDGADKFGTTIVLGVDDQFDLESRVTRAHQTRNVVSGLCLDPTYPVRDGAVTHLLPVVACGFIFGRKADVAPIVKGKALY